MTKVHRDTARLAAGKCPKDFGPGGLGWVVVVFVVWLVVAGGLLG